MQKNELLKISKDRRDWLSSKEYGGNTFSIIKEDGMYRDFINNVCYRQLEEVEDEKAVFIVDIVRKNGVLSNELVMEYVNWWVRDSFVADAFITKKEETILKKGCILDCSYPANYVVFAMIGLRYMWEFPQIVKNWGMFKEYVNYDSAIIMAHMFSTDDNKTWEGHFKCANSNHTWFQTYWDKKEFTQAVDHDLSALPTLPPMSEKMTYIPLLAIFSPQRKVAYSSSKGNLLYPLSPASKYVMNSFGERTRGHIEIYTKKDMKMWLQKTFDLNYLNEKRKKNES